MAAPDSGENLHGEDSDKAKGIEDGREVVNPAGDTVEIKEITRVPKS